MRLSQTGQAMALLLTTVSAHAVIVRGTVTGPFGQPVPGARVQLISLGQSTRSLADAVSGVDGMYEIRTDLSGRFLILTSSLTYAPQIGADFYAGRTDLVTRDIALDPSALTPTLSQLTTGLDTPLAQLSTLLTQIAADRLVTRAFLPEALAQTPGAIVVQTGQQLQPADLYLRGANPNSNTVLIDGIQAQDFGGHFNYGNFSSTGIAAVSSLPAVEILPGPNPLNGPTSEAGTVSFTTPRSANIRPVLNYSGDAGNLNSYRNEGSIGLTRRRADLFATYGRFDTSNALITSAAHSATAAANMGYHIAANTSLRLTLRQEDNVAPLPVPYDLGLFPTTRQADQNTYGTFTVDTRTARDWHTQARYGLVRKRDEVFAYAQYSGRPVTLRGANGSTVTGIATAPLLPQREYQATNRDEFSLSTDSPLLRNPRHPLSGLFAFRYQNERAQDYRVGIVIPSFDHHLNPTNFNFAAAVKAQLRQRLFAELSGYVNHSSLFNLTADPRLGLTYTPVYPSSRRFHGTALHLTLATGTGQPSLPEYFAGITSHSRSRTFDLAADQKILGARLILHAGYFHNQFSHQTEILNLQPLVLSSAQAFRTQGFLSELRYQPFSRLFLRGGYTYTASLIEQSAATTSLYTPTVGNRPFRRPPHSGFFAIQYTGRTLTASLQASLAGRSDDSTSTPTLLLPNRNLDFGYTRLDANLTYAILHNVTVFAQAANLLNDQHIGPIGYPGTPLTYRAGLKFRFGGE